MQVQLGVVFAHSVSPSRLPPQLPRYLGLHSLIPAVDEVPAPHHQPSVPSLNVPEYRHNIGLLDIDPRLAAFIPVDNMLLLKRIDGDGVAFENVSDGVRALVLLDLAADVGLLVGDMQA